MMKPKSKNSDFVVLNNNFNSLKHHESTNPTPNTNPFHNLQIPSSPKKVLSNGNLRSNLIPSIIAEENYEDEEDLINFVQKVGDNLTNLIKTQRGSRMMQKFLNKMSREDADFLLQKLSVNFREIMNDSYGNYFMQKMIQCCGSEQRMFILENIRESFLEIGNNPSGTHSVQSLIEIISTPKEEAALIKCIEMHMMKLSCNSNGTHIIQKLIMINNEANREYINDFVINNLSKLCMNANGICVVKRFINSSKDNNIRERLLEKFTSNCLVIVQDPYGNYAIQFIIETYGYIVTQKIVLEILNNLILLSTQKFSSNVVERVIESSDKTIYNRIVGDMFLNSTNFMVLLKNKYGNFVLQKLINIMNSNEKISIKLHLIKNVTCNGNKERTKFSSILDLLCLSGSNNYV